jgi:hypothetical protein
MVEPHAMVREPAGRGAYPACSVGTGQWKNRWKSDDGTESLELHSRPN